MAVGDITLATIANNGRLRPTGTTAYLVQRAVNNGGTLEAGDGTDTGAIPLFQLITNNWYATATISSTQTNLVAYEEVTLGDSPGNFKLVKGRWAPPSGQIWRVLAHVRRGSTDAGDTLVGKAPPTTSNLGTTTSGIKIAAAGDLISSAYPLWTEQRTGGSSNYQYKGGVVSLVRVV